MLYSSSPVIILLLTFRKRIKISKNTDYFKKYGIAAFQKLAGIAIINYLLKG